MTFSKHAGKYVPIFQKLSFQSEFYRLGYSLLKDDCFISSEVPVPVTGQRGSSGRVDFVVKNGDRKWAVELLINGDNTVDGMTQAESHYARFNGKYSSLKGCRLQTWGGAKKEFVEFNSDSYM